MNQYGGIDPMALDQKRLQKKKAKRAAKAKARKQTAGRALVNIPSGLPEGASAPVYECWWPGNEVARENGLAQVIVSRKRKNNQILAAVFLVDLYCLGAKNAFIRVCSELEFKELLDHIRRDRPLERTDPSCARKLVEGAVDFARNLGFAPHKDYAKSAHIFGDIDADLCSRTFVFGLDGKPFYVSGPNDSPGFIRRVMRTLEKNCGPDAFHYLTTPED